MCVNGKSLTKSHVARLKEVKVCDIKARDLWEVFSRWQSDPAYLANTNHVPSPSRLTGTGLSLTSLRLGWPVCRRENLRPNGDLNDPS